MAYTSFTSTIDKSPEWGTPCVWPFEGHKYGGPNLCTDIGFESRNRMKSVVLTEKETVHLNQEPGSCLNTFSNTSTSSTIKEQKTEPYDKFWIKCLFCPFSAVPLNPSSSGCHCLLVWSSWLHNSKGRVRAQVSQARNMSIGSNCCETFQV